MRTVPGIAMIASIALASSFASGQEPSDVETAVDALVAQYVEGWNAGDAAACAATYSEDATEIDLAGQIHEGKTAIQENIAATLEQYPGSTITINRSSLYTVKPDVVVSDGAWQIEGSATEGAPTKGFYTIVVAKSGDSWLVVSGLAKVPPPAPPME